jgi:hypothetical protein
MLLVIISVVSRLAGELEMNLNRSAPWREGVAMAVEIY